MENLADLLINFQILKKKYVFEPISNGLINDTYLVSSKGIPLYILQKINTDVFQNTESLFKNLDLVLPELEASTYQKVELIAVNNAKNYHQTESGEIWRLMTYVKDSQVFNTTNDVKVALEAGKIIGLFHHLLLDFDANILEDTLPDFHNFNLRHDQFLGALKNAESEKVKASYDAIEFVTEKSLLFLDLPLKNLPVRVCHNDTKLNNILFSKKNKALCLIDLDTLMKGTFLYDFGDAARTIVNTAKEDEIDLEKINFTPKLFEALISGLAMHAEFLTAKEKELLPLSVALMPFLHGIRALTDFLENNKYYKVAYPNQNLDRARSLFAFSKKALENRTFMQNCIREKLG
jgi:Ser/Thr protein kinase RdoA (MazF antagonist)